MHRRDGSAADLIRPQHIDLFRAPSGETMLRSRRLIRALFTESRTAHNASNDIGDQLCRPRIIVSLGALPSSKMRGPRSRFQPTRWELACAQIVAVTVMLWTRSKRMSRALSRGWSARLFLVLTCMTMEDMDRYPDAQRSAAERLMAVQGTAMAIQTLLLAAHAAGVGASVMCAPLFCPDIVRSALDPTARLGAAGASHTWVSRGLR